jgi:hypothetical protein
MAKFDIILILWQDILLIEPSQIILKLFIKNHQNEKNNKHQRVLARIFFILQRISLLI